MKHERCGFDPWRGKIPWRKAQQPTPVCYLENPLDRGAWLAVVHRVIKNWTRMKPLSMHACHFIISSKHVTSFFPPFVPILTCITTLSNVRGHLELFSIIPLIIEKMPSWSTEIQLIPNSAQMYYILISVITMECWKNFILHLILHRDQRYFSHSPENSTDPFPFLVFQAPISSESESCVQFIASP